MRGTRGFLRRQRRHRPSLTPWLALFLSPIVVLFLLLTHADSLWLDRGATHPKSAAILPGLTVEAATPLNGPLVITSIQSNSPATGRGLAVGDAVVAIDGEPIFSLDQARSTLQKDKAGTVALRVVHGRQFHEVRLDRPSPGHEGDRHGPQAAGG